MIKIGYALPVLFASLTAGLNQAQAASDAECTQYAETTVRQYADNLELGCGFSGLRWHDNKLGHFVFCKAADLHTINAEIEVRAAMLKQCTPDAVEDPAPESVEQQVPAREAEVLTVEDDEDQELQLEADDLADDELPADDLLDDEDFIDEG
ncbi:hypothetical protein [Hoeflea sp.]|uniref:hypothetical protein n=1 Tax=Hoeflea sp. TaxID=1940281 RepID=UPI003B028772